MSEAERISLEKRLGQIQCELGEACRKKEAARGEALFAEQCRHHAVLGWTAPRRPKGSMFQERYFGQTIRSTK